MPVRRKSDGEAQKILTEAEGVSASNCNGKEFMMICFGNMEASRISVSISPVSAYDTVFFIDECNICKFMPTACNTQAKKGMRK